MKSVLITGCSSGFGLKAAVTFAKNGFRVFATMRNVSKRSALDAALQAAGVKAEVLALDVTDKASIDAAVATVLVQAGSIDVLVNNAGFGVGGSVEDMSMEDYRRQFDTNFFGLVAVTKAVLPHMRAKRAGRIINISSIGGRAANPFLSAYVASKFAVEGFSEALAFEASLFDVDVVLIEPGAFKTDILEANREFTAAARDPNSPYAAVSNAFIEKIDASLPKMADDPQKVADAILHAATVAKPRLRYLVGIDAKIMGAVHRWLGFGAYAALIRQYLGWPELAAKMGPIRERPGSVRSTSLNKGSTQ
jgi:NAD(P)-dependent dehydrogenase (short-subunit alcohol dehydrogenase family)